MFKGRFNGTKKPTPAEVQKFCDAAAQPDGSGELHAFIDKFGKDAVDSICPKTGYTALMRAAQNGQTPNCLLLLVNGANVNVQDKDGWTPLITAVNQDRRETVAVLLENKADINLADKNSVTPLMTAAREANEDLVKLLLERGANPLLKNLAKQNAAAVARSVSTGPDDLGHARVTAILDTAVAAAQKIEDDASAATLVKSLKKMEQDFTGGTDKPVTVSRPLSFKS